MHPFPEPDERSGSPEARLARAVAELFRKGIRLSDEAWHYIHSTCGCTGPETLEALLTDGTDPEVETLLELIFFPDRAQQASLENLIASGGFHENSEAAALAMLLHEPLEALVMLPGDSIDIRVPVPEWAARAFLVRLRIRRILDPRLAASVDQHVREENRALVKVSLRNSRFEQSEKKVRFLCNFFKGLGGEENDFLPMVDFLLGFLGEIDDGEQIYRALVRRKRLCFRSLQQAMSFEAQLERHNIETLLLRGVRVPHIDKEQMRCIMGWIDRICLAVFGRTEPVGGEAAGEGLEVDASGDITSVIRSLS
jgi:hypothetical protein